MPTSAWEELKYSYSYEQKTKNNDASWSCVLAFHTGKIKTENITIELRVDSRRNYVKMRDMNDCVMFSSKKETSKQNLTSERMSVFPFYYYF